MRVVVYCNAGRHRSVAVSQLLGRVLTKFMRGVEVSHAAYVPYKSYKGSRIV